MYLNLLVVDIYSSNVQPSQKIHENL